MKIKLLTDKSIAGEQTVAGTIVIVGNLVGKDLIDKGDAEAVIARPKKKAAVK